ncbi:hypothetical protein KR018_001572, partial [Drosophila ironensis]
TKYSTMSSSWVYQQCELYPQRRNTEYYRTPRPRRSIQSHQAEHPRILDKPLPKEPVYRGVRIQPPNNPDMRDARNSYFS